MKDRAPSEIAPVEARRLRQENLEQNREVLKREGEGRARRGGMRRERQDRIILERRRQRPRRRISRATVWSSVILAGLLAMVWILA
jgi:hypothetical protein